MDEWLGPLATAARQYGGWLTLFITLIGEVIWFRKQLSTGGLITREQHEAVVEARVGQYKDRCQDSERRADKYLDLLLQQTPAFRQAAEALVREKAP